MKENLMTDLKEKALRTAARLHSGHKYNDGSYLENHLERVAHASIEIAKKNGIDEEEVLEFIYCVAMLHDVLEDCFDYSVTTLEKEHKKLAERFNTGIANAVLILSDNSFNSDEEYLKAVSENMITKIVKTADRISNILTLPEVEGKRQRERYAKKYLDQLPLFEKYDIYPDLIKKAFWEMTKI